MKGINMNKYKEVYQSIKELIKNEEIMKKCIAIFSIISYNRDKKCSSICTRAFFITVKYTIRVYF